jgi:hypothetical protein
MWSGSISRRGLPEAAMFYITSVDMKYIDKVKEYVPVMG